MASLSTMGIGSGLDLSSLVTQLVAAERATKDTRFNTQEATIQAKISAYGTLRGGLSTIESPLKRLSEFEAKQSVTNSNKTALTVTAADDAPIGKYTIDVGQIATSQSLATNAADASTLFAEGAATEIVAEGDTATFSIQIGSGDATEIALDGTEGALTLADLRTAINDADAGVTASIMNDGNGARLVLTAVETGAENTIVTTATGMASAALDTGLSLDGSVANTNGKITQEAQDAQAAINGITITSSSNVLDEAVDGLSITLNAATEESATVQVAEDQSSLRSLLNEFIAGYNELIGQTNSLTAYDAENESAALLMGDATVRTLRSMLGNAMVEYGQTLEGDDLALANVGIVSGKDGKLSFDQAAYSEAMDGYGAENVTAAVKDIASRFYDIVTSYTSSSDGALAARTDGLRARLDVINEQRDEFDQRMIAFEDRLVAQFTAMDTLIAQMNNTSNYLATQLNNLNSSSK